MRNIEIKNRTVISSNIFYYLKQCNIVKCVKGFLNKCDPSNFIYSVMSHVFFLATSSENGECFTCDSLTGCSCFQFFALRVSSENHSPIAEDAQQSTVSLLADARRTAYIKGRWIITDSGYEQRYRIVLPTLPGSGNYSLACNYLMH